MTELASLPQFRLEKSILNDFSASPSYIMHLAQNEVPAGQSSGSAAMNCVASSSSDLAIKLYDFDPSSGALSFLHSLSGNCPALLVFLSHHN
jgi:hypothetical protein